MTLVLLASLAVAQPPQAPPLEHRVVILEMKAQQHDARLSALESKSVAKAPAPVVTQPISATEFSPTWHYPPNTVLVQDANGVLVPSQAATHISYPNGPMQVAPPPQFYAPRPPVMYQSAPYTQGAFFGRGLFGRRGGGRVCVGGNCG